MLCPLLWACSACKGGPDRGDTAAPLSCQLTQGSQVQPAGDARPHAPPCGRHTILLLPLPVQALGAAAAPCGAQDPAGRCTKLGFQ